VVRFVHTADWQLGMTRAFLPAEAQARYDADRIEAVRSIGRLAEAQDCEFVLVCGDVFEHPQIGERTAARAMKALAAIRVPVYLLPGNHDPLGAGSVFRCRWFTKDRPEHVHVLDHPGPVPVRPGVELLAAPWFGKQAPQPQIDALAADCEPEPGAVRIAVGHGAVDVTMGGSLPQQALRFDLLAQAIGRRSVDYVALGDRHSLTDVGGLGRIWYSGTPEPTRASEIAPGQALVVDLAADRAPEVTPHRIGRWTITEEHWELESTDGVNALLAWLDAFLDDNHTVAKPVLHGELNVADHAYLVDELDRRRLLFAAIPPSRRSDLSVFAQDTDLAGLGMSGFAAQAAETLRADGSATALAALGLLLRLSRRVEAETG
jgi:DNA repair exonuclease SbcCD nuclease subunit